MVDEHRLLRLLHGIEDDTAFLRGLAERDPDALVGDDLALSAIKYRFITAIEGCAKIAHHIAAAEGWPAAESNSEAVRYLAQRDVLERALAGSIGDAVSFRNVLVHQYAEVDDRKTVGHLGRLDDLAAFSSAIARWLRDREGSEPAPEGP